MQTPKPNQLNGYEAFDLKRILREQERLTARAAKQAPKQTPAKRDYWLTLDNDFLFKPYREVR
jgi:hypothetical protein